MRTIIYEIANKVEEEVCKQEVDLVCTDKPMTECREVQFQVSTLWNPLKDVAYSSSQFVFREELEEVCTEVVEEECTLQEEQVCQQVAEGRGGGGRLNISG